MQHQQSGRAQLRRADISALPNDRSRAEGSLTCEQKA